VASAELRNLFKLTGDRSVLTKVLQTARAAQFRSSNDFATHMQQHSAWLAALPSCLRLGGSYVRPHISRKHAMGFDARAVRKGRGAVDWNKINTFAALKQLMPDRCRYLDTVPSWLKPTALSTQMGCGQLWLSMWPCLMREVLQGWPGIVHVVAAHLPQINQCLDAYMAKHNVPPCPFVLVREFVETLPAKSRPARAMTVIDSGSDEADEEEADDRWRGGESSPEACDSGDDSVGGGAPVRKRPAGSRGAGLSGQGVARRKHGTFGQKAPKQSNREGASLLVG